MTLFVDTVDMQRTYSALSIQFEPLLDRRDRMQAFVDMVWDALNATGISWIGFYLYESDEALVLGPCRDKPACSPIGMHGVCGQVLRRRQPMVVRDVADLGDNYVACDPRDRSEVVIPLLDEAGRSWGVLDADSHAVGAFTDADVTGLGRLLRQAGLTRIANSE